MPNKKLDSLGGEFLIIFIDWASLFPWQLFSGERTVQLSLLLSVLLKAFTGQAAYFQVALFTWVWVKWFNLVAVIDLHNFVLNGSTSGSKRNHFTLCSKTHPIFCSHNIDHNRRLQFIIDYILGALASPDVLMAWFSHHVKLASHPGSLPRGLAEPKFWGQIRYSSSPNPCILLYGQGLNNFLEMKTLFDKKTLSLPPRQHKAFIWLIKLRYQEHNHLVLGMVKFTMGGKKWWTTCNQVYPLYMWGKSYISRICQIWMSFWNRIVQKSPLDWLNSSSQFRQQKK